MFSEEMPTYTKPTESRIEFIRNLLKDNKLKGMIELDIWDTDSAVSVRLDKKFMDIKALLNSMNVKLKYFKSDTYGHTFKAISTNKQTILTVLIRPFPKDDYGPINSLSRPENAELRMLKLLSNFVIRGYTPHIILPINTFDTSITHFTTVPKHIIDLADEKNALYKTFIERYNDGELEDVVSVLISEWCNGGDLLDYIRKNYATMTLKTWTVIIFQILFTLTIIHNKYPAFRHNNLKANNIWVQLSNIEKKNKYRYDIENYKFLIPNINLQIRLAEFDFACIDGVIENNKVNAEWTKKINITKKENKYYDMHYFFNTLTSKIFFPQFYEGGAPAEIVDFVHRIIPTEYRINSENVNKRGRILVDVEYTTPYKVIMEDPLFDKYRFN